MKKLTEILRRIYFCGGDKLREEKDINKAKTEILKLLLTEDDMEKEIDFWLQHLVAKVTDKNDYISKDKRIEGHKQSIGNALVTAQRGNL